MSHVKTAEQLDNEAPSASKLGEEKVARTLSSKPLGVQKREVQSAKGNEVLTLKRDAFIPENKTTDHVYTLCASNWGSNHTKSFANADACTFGNEPESDSGRALASFPGLVCNGKRHAWSDGTGDGQGLYRPGLQADSVGVHGSQHD